MYGRNAKTVIMTEGLDMLTTYQTINQPADLGAIYAHGGQVVFTFKRTSGASITFKIDEWFDENTGWVPRTEDDGTNLTLIERISTEAAFSYAFTTAATKVRVQAKASSTNEDLDLYLTVGEIL